MMDMMADEKYKGRIRLIRTSELKTQDDRESKKVWQRIWQWRHGATETAAENMWQRGDTMGTKKEVRDDDVGGGYGRNQICGTTRTATVMTREDKIRDNDLENIKSFPPRGTATDDSMDHYPCTS